MEIKQKKSIVVFETIDSDSLKHYETKSGSSYDAEIIDFIRSLGFDVQYKYPETNGLTEHIIIDGVEAFLYTNACSYMAQSAYNRDIKPRKNRFFGIHPFHTTSDTDLIKVPFNVEIDKEKLVKRISEFVKDKADNIKSRQDIKNAKDEICEKLKKRIQSSSVLSKGLISIHVKNGDLMICKNFGAVCFNIELWSFKSFSPCVIPFSTWEDILNAPAFALKVSLDARENVNSITQLGSCLTESEVLLTKSMDEYSKL